MANLLELKIGDRVEFTPNPFRNTAKPLEAERQWHIVRCVRGSDQQALEAFRHRRIETYYPKIIDLRRVPLRKLTASQRVSGVEIQRPVQAPLFPRYIFISAILRDLDWKQLFDEIGIGGFTCEGNKPVRVRDADLAKIRSRENGGLIDGRDSVRIIFALHEGVTITSGPFAGFPAIVEKGLDVPIGDLDPTTRLRVLVNLFGASTPVELEMWQVAKAV